MPPSYLNNAPVENARNNTVMPAKHAPAESDGWNRG